MTIKNRFLAGLICLARCCCQNEICVAIVMICSIPFWIIGGFVFLIFFAGPFFYFFFNSEIFGSNEISEKYRREGIQSSGRVIKRWSHSGDKSGIRYYVRVLYHTPEDETYVKDLQVSAALQSQECVDLVILPEYPRSARIKPASIDRNSNSEVSSTEGGRWFGVGWSFFWVCVWNIGVSYSFTVNKLEDDLDFVAKYLVACEVVLAWITGYFLVRAQRNASFRGMLFGGKPCSSSGEASQDQMKTPNIAYHEMFPSSNKSFLDIIWIIINDYAKLLVGFLVGLYFLLFGGIYCLMYPLIVDRKIKHLLSEDYLTRGEEVEGTVVHRATTKVEVEYIVIDETLQSNRRYRKTLPVPRYSCNKGQYFPCSCPRFESKPVPDNPRIIVVPNIPTSARLADEIELCHKIYKKSWAYLIMAVIIFGFQTANATLVGGGLLFPNIPAWDMALINIALQLCLGCLGGIIIQRIAIHRVLYNATNVADDEGTELEDENTIESAVSTLEGNGTSRLENYLSEKKVAQSDKVSNEPLSAVV